VCIHYVINSFLWFGFDVLNIREWECILVLVCTYCYREFFKEGRMKMRTFSKIFSEQNQTVSLYLSSTNISYRWCVHTTLTNITTFTILNQYQCLYVSVVFGVCVNASNLFASFPSTHGKRFQHCFPNFPCFR
jgi:hypothetical protein